MRENCYVTVSLSAVQSDLSLTLSYKEREKEKVFRWIYADH